MKWFCYGQEKRRWVCEEGTEDRPHNSAVLKPHQPKRERREDEYGAGGALTGGVKRSLICCPTFPSAQAGRPAGCCPEVTPPYLPFGPQMNRDQFGGGRKNKGATCVLKCLFSSALGVRAIGKPQLNCSPMWKEPFAVPVTSASPVPACYRLSAPHQFSHLLYPCNCCCICTEHVQSLT